MRPPRWGESDILTHSDLVLSPDPSRTVIRPFLPGDPDGYVDKQHPRAQRIADRVLALNQTELDNRLATLRSTLDGRHRDLEETLLRRYDEVDEEFLCTVTPSREQKLIIGAYFAEEYSFESAALFNPSMIRHPREPASLDGGVRFVMSLRGIGEGHVSSVTFRTGNWSVKSGFTVDPASNEGVTPRIESSEGDEADYTVRLTTENARDISEVVIFPTSESQRRGVEDMRLVTFTEDDGTVEIYGTYTAFDGVTARSELLHGHSFRHFSMRPLKGRAAGAKGMALFPRKIDGRYRMLSRQDNENVWLLESDDLYCWDEGGKLISPKAPWEFVQVGNCGSPIEIEEGWLLMTHGVGMVRNYSIGACLLDKKDPSKVLARMKEPLLKPSAKARDGYVPNVVYSCGGMVHDRTLLLPYGMADTLTSFASVPLDILLGAME